MESLNSQSFKTKVFDISKGKKWRFEGSAPAVIDFYADWCGPCRTMTPILENLEKKYAGRVNFYKVNIEEQSDIAAMFKVRSIPTLLFVPIKGTPTISTGLIPADRIERGLLEVIETRNEEKNGK